MQVHDHARHRKRGGAANDDDEEEEEEEEPTSDAVFIPPDRVEEEPFSVLYYFKSKATKIKCTAWFKVAKILVLCQPSSAMAERVFSLLESYFPKKGTRAGAKADLIDGTLKLSAHGRPV